MAATGHTPGEPFSEAKLITADNRVLGGADVIVHLGRRIWWLRPLYLLSLVPGMKSVMDVVYRWVADNRHNPINKLLWTEIAPLTLLTWLVPALLVAIPIMLRPLLVPWAFMWVLAFGICESFKWLSWLHVRKSARHHDWTRTAAYFLAWPGMHARRFFDNERVGVAMPPTREWLSASAKTIFGFLLLFACARLWPAANVMARAWTGAVGLIFLLHFGIFHILSLLWRRVGVDAPPIMRLPIASTSVAELWGARWNMAFRDPAHVLVFRPTRRRFGVVTALFAVFLLSALVHDTVISLPASAGYGLPSAYFLLQFAGILIERSTVGRRVGLGRGIRGWAFTLILALFPIPLLFHAPFMTRVIIPFMETIHAL